MKTRISGKTRRSVFSVRLTEADAARVRTVALAKEWTISKTIEQLVVAALDAKLAIMTEWVTVATAAHLLGTTRALVTKRARAGEFETIPDPANPGALLINIGAVEAALGRPIASGGQQANIL
ncbi:MAG: hypothetical protein L0Z50_31005 [Verrucomicrobiales bacterium]|nr:hypothetical protein [Verrucomicrobiales bacterium]